jgi:hypothetical protein
MDGAEIGHHDQLEGNTQAQKDERCATMCEQTPGCEIWVVDARHSSCTLKRSSRTSGLANKGFLGISGQKIGHWLGSVIEILINHVLKTSHICNKDEDKDNFFDMLVATTGPNVSVVGEGSVSLEVPESFFNTVDLETADAKSNMQAFKVSEKHLVGSMTAKTPELQSAVDVVLQSMEQSFAGPMVTQTASPLAFWLGAVLAQCLDDPAKCGTETVDVALV